MSSKTNKIFVNLPVENLDRSVEFFTQLGYTFNPQFTDENATCMIISDSIFAMLLVKPYFKGFTKKEIPNTTTDSEVIVALSADTRATVDELVDNAIKAGAKITNEPSDLGFMY
ncbi:VOC family protein [Carnobacterium maltaromaticum]